ncbi:hypothetical protein [Piscinibacter koreensis]|uniref:Uncharacterized protein n=1 Tax=Piscinibacter koreensis TaxID=2742824 RepID=A0A7Y6TZ92_9BURK|nr:hypothetical protein [Schlegelella koreensis]NUZ09063.1 hypothetical protein [Schlegelella koreensis]
MSKFGGDPAHDYELTVACGERLTRAASKRPLVKAGLEVLGVERMLRDYATYWHEAQSDQEKHLIWSDYRKNVRDCILRVLGIHWVVGGSIHLVFYDLRFTLLLLVVITILIRNITR